MSSKLTLSPYKVHWIEFFPSKGLVTKHDRKVFGEIVGLRTPAPKSFRKHFPSKDAALKYLSDFSSRLDKDYTCYIFTDKQFGLASEENGFAIPYTKKQLENPYYLKSNKS